MRSGSAPLRHNPEHFFLYKSPALTILEAENLTEVRIHVAWPGHLMREEGHRRPHRLKRLPITDKEAPNTTSDP